MREKRSTDKVDQTCMNKDRKYNLFTSTSLLRENCLTGMNYIHLKCSSMPFDMIHA